MRIEFRQGLVSFQTDTGTPVYLVPSITPGFITHAISPTPTVAALAHGESDYLLKFDDTVVNAWGPIVPAVTNHLYWDVDALTTNVTRNITVLEPIYSQIEPILPANDQHWFDLTSNLMKVWSVGKNKWFEKIRIFAGSVLNGNVNTISMYSAGSQAGLAGPANPGFILLDSALQPLRKASKNGEFLTDDDEARVLTTVGTSGVLVSPVNKIIPVKAGENIPRMSLVYFSSDDTVRLASSNPALIVARPPVGILIDAVVGGDIGTLVQSGEIIYDQWDFTGQAGKPVYCDSFGQLTLVRPAGLIAYRVGFVKNPRTVLFNIDSETAVQVIAPSSNQLLILGQPPIQISDVLNGIGERIVTVSVTNATATQPGLMTAAQFLSLLDHEVRITTAESDIDFLQLNKADINHNHDLVYAPIIHTHIISNVFGLQAALDNKSNIGHTHIISEVTGLQAALDNKSNIGHTHALSQLTDVDLVTTPPANGNALIYSSGQWIPGTVSGGGGNNLPAVKVWGNTGTVVSIPNVAANAIWAGMALPVQNVINHPVVDTLPLVTSTVVPADENTADIGVTRISVNDNGQYQISIRGNIKFTYGNPLDVIKGMVRITVTQSLDAAEATVGSRVLGYVDIQDAFAPSQRVLNQTSFGFNQVFSSGLNLSQLDFTISNYLHSDALVPVPEVTIEDVFIRVIKLENAAFAPPPAFLAPNFTMNVLSPVTNTFALYCTLYQNSSPTNEFLIDIGIPATAPTGSYAIVDSLTGNIIDLGANVNLNHVLGTPTYYTINTISTPLSSLESTFLNAVWALARLDGLNPPIQLLTAVVPFCGAI